MMMILSVKKIGAVFSLEIIVTAKLDNRILNIRHDMPIIINRKSRSTVIFVIDRVLFCNATGLQKILKVHKLRFTSLKNFLEPSSSCHKSQSIKVRIFRHYSDTHIQGNSDHDLSISDNEITTIPPLSVRISAVSPIQLNRWRDSLHVVCCFGTCLSS